MRVFAGFSAALAAQAIGKKAYRMTKLRSRSLSAIPTPRRGATACAVSEILTDLLQLARQAEVERGDPGRDEEDEHRQRGGEAVIDAAATLSAGERKAEGVRDEILRGSGGLRLPREGRPPLRDEVNQREFVEFNRKPPEE